MKPALHIGLAFAAASIVGAVAAIGVHRGTPAHVLSARYDGVMGTSLDIKVQAASEAAARGAEAAIRDEIARETTILSAYDPASEFSRWTRSRAVPATLSPELLDVLSAFDEWRVRTDGALDPAAEALTRLWKQAAAEDRLPTPGELRTTLDRVRQRHWIVDRAAATAVRASDVPLALHSFTKSFVVDRAARRALALPGVTGVLIDAGGDVVVRGQWTQSVGVADPIGHADNAPSIATLAVRDAVVATSGGYKRGFDIGGRHYSHVLDPRTGQPTGHVLSATVVSANAVEAGALATAFCVLTPGESAALARTRPGVEYVLVLEGDAVSRARAGIASPAAPAGRLACPIPWPPSTPRNRPAPRPQRR